MSNQTVLSSKVFNTDVQLASGENLPLLGHDLGLLDSINRTDDTLFNHYKNLKSLDWDENEFDYSTCRNEFEKGDVDSGIMIDTIAWQWETDTVVARILQKVIASFVTDSDAILGYARIIDNENLHALTYSEIKRTAFVDPNVIMAKVLANEAAHARLSEPGKIFEEARIAAAKYELGMITREEALPIAILFFAALPSLERAQFMPSFAITAAYHSVGRFVAIGNGVQKICQDEFDVHIPFNKAYFLRCIATPEGQRAFDMVYPRIIKLLNGINLSERAWVNDLFEGRRFVASVDKESILAFNDYSASDMAIFFGLEDKVDFPIIKTNPLPYMDEFANISMSQKSPQEEDNNQYKLNVVKFDDEDKVFSLKPKEKGSFNFVL